MSEPGTPDLRDIARSIPARFQEQLEARPAEGYSTGAEWLRALPRLVADLAGRWELRATAPLRTGHGAIAVPCDGRLGPGVLEVGWPHEEAATEHLALRAWDGRGAVRLLAADPHHFALLLESADADRDLCSVDVDECSRVTGLLLRELDRPALPRVADGREIAPRWAEQLQRYGEPALPRRVVERGVSAFRALAETAGDRQRLVHTDLHCGNVLAATRSPWLAIDPKALNTLPEAAVAPMLWNRAEEALASGSPRNHLRRRLEICCETAGLDAPLAYELSLARVALNVAWDVEDGVPPGSEELTWMVTVAKAMQA